jgi:hypothetical protein
MEPHPPTPQDRAGESGAAHDLWMERTGWVRCQVMGGPAELWTPVRRDTERRVEATTHPEEDPGMLKKAKHRAGAILSGSAELYRELALSALRLVRR